MTILAGTPYECRTFHRVARCTLSNAFLKSMKLINRGVFHSKHCSIMFRSANICSLHPLLFLTPAYSYLSLLSIAASILNRRTLQKTLQGKDTRVIPRLLAFWRSPFFGSLTIRPFVQSAGMVSLVQMVVKRLVRIFVNASMSAFSISAWMESMPGALPLFMALMWQFKLQPR